MTVTVTVTVTVRVRVRVAVAPVALSNSLCIVPNFEYYTRTHVTNCYACIQRPHARLPIRPKSRALGARVCPGSKARSLGKAISPADAILVVGDC